MMFMKKFEEVMMMFMKKFEEVMILMKKIKELMMILMKKFEELIIMLINQSVKYCKPQQKRQASVFYSVLFSFSGGNLHEMSVFFWKNKNKTLKYVVC